MRKDKKLAIVLRKSGKSYVEISNILQIPKSTLSGWFKQLRYSQKVKKRLSSAAAQQFSENINKWNRVRAEQYLQQRQATAEKAADQIPNITKDNLLFLGLGLFWAEGSKKERFSARFANSDPAIILFWIKFLEQCCGISKDRITVNIHLHPNISDKVAKNYWSKLLDLPLSQFRKSQTAVSLRSRYKRAPNTLPYGTCHVQVNSSALKQNIDGWLLGLRRQIMVA